MSNKLVILLHSSKTMVQANSQHTLSKPLLFEKAKNLYGYVSQRSADELARIMRISPSLAEKTAQLYAQDISGASTAAVDSFRGDIFSGLRALDWSNDEAEFAQKHIRILSGLYGVLRPYDAVVPYRLEAAYRFPDANIQTSYHYWGSDIASHLDAECIVNLTSNEYARLFLPYVDHGVVRVVSPKFLTQKGSGDEPVFVAVHAKIARGAFARWMIMRRVQDVAHLHEFSDLGYSYDASRSTEHEPVFVCHDFGGIGLSRRLT